jgi:hypothetical protein
MAKYRPLCNEPNYVQFTLVVSSCPWKIDAQATRGVQITLAREKYLSLPEIKNVMNKQKDVPFSK